MMTSPAIVGEADVRAALFRVRVLLALHDQMKHCCEKKKETTVKVVTSPHSRTESNFSDDSTRLYTVSLHSTYNGEGSFDDAVFKSNEGMPQQNYYYYDLGGDDNINGSKKDKEKKSTIINVLPLPPLRWPPPTLQERFVAIEKGKEKKRRRTAAAAVAAAAGHSQKPRWFGAGSLAAICGSHDFADKRASCYTQGGVCVSSSSSSCLTLTGDHSDRSDSQDTYAASNASIDDVYIHELAREFGSSPNTRSGAPHSRWNSLSLNVSGKRWSSSVGSLKNDMAVASSESTAVAAQREFDRIGTGEEAPYTSYLFLPDVRVIDLSSMRLSVFDAKNRDTSIDNNVTDNQSGVTSNSNTKSGDFEKVTDNTLGAENKVNLDGKAVKDGCTKVCFSPEGNCFVIGTLRGDLWFVQVNTVTSYSATATTTSPILLQGHSGAVTDVAFDDVGTFFASGGEDLCVILWNQRTRLKVRRINTDGGIPSIVRFTPKNNNYLLVSIPQHHLFRLYNSSTGLPVTRKGPVMRVQATAVAMESCSAPFFFVGDVHGTIAMWRCCVSSNDDGVLPSVLSADQKLEEKPEPRSHRLSLASDVATVATKASALSFTAEKPKKQRQRAMSLTAEGQMQFEKMASLVVAKGTPVGALVVNSMNHQQFHSLLRVQQNTQKKHEQNTVRKWATTSLTHAQQRHTHSVLSFKTNRAAFTRSACAVMLLASYPCDFLEIICVQPTKSTPREYNLVSMLIIDGACRIRHVSAGTAFCVDNTRCPTISSTCEEGFVQIITCTTAHQTSFKKTEGVKNSGLLSHQTQWNVMTTLPMPCGGVPVSLAWSPDMRLLVAVTEEGTLYEWRRVYINQNKKRHPYYHKYQNTHRRVCSNFNGDDNYRDDEDSSTGMRVQDEVEEWQMYFQREKQRQMRQYHLERNESNSSRKSLSNIDDWCTQS